MVDTIGCFSPRQHCDHANEQHDAGSWPLEDDVKNMGDEVPCQRLGEVHVIQLYNVDLEVDATSCYAPYQEALNCLQQHYSAHQVYCIDGEAEGPD